LRQRLLTFSLCLGGIGPADQLNIVAKSSDGPSMIPRTQWIDLPVGYNLMDHLNTDLIVSHPNVSFYDFYQAWETPFVSDENTYLLNRSGILAQAAPNIGPMVSSGEEWPQAMFKTQF
jgi:cellobiose dehydrogenase (acceptor)